VTPFQYSSFISRLPDFALRLFFHHGVIRIPHSNDQNTIFRGRLCGCASDKRAPQRSKDRCDFCFQSFRGASAVQFFTGILVASARGA
jgi:hypothetical protein